jgi:hypothetical protein
MVVQAPISYRVGNTCLDGFAPSEPSEAFRPGIPVCLYDKFGTVAKLLNQRQNGIIPGLSTGENLEQGRTEGI